MDTTNCLSANGTRLTERETLDVFLYSQGEAWYGVIRHGSVWYYLAH